MEASWCSRVGLQRSQTHAPDHAASGEQERGHQSPHEVACSLVGELPLGSYPQTDTALLGVWRGGENFILTQQQ